MKKRKTPKADLESKRGIFFQIGLIVTLAAILLAFEWKSFDQTVFSIDSTIPIEVIDEVAITISKPLPLPPPKLLAFELIIVEEVEFDDTFEFDAEVFEHTKIPEYIPFVVEEEEIVEWKIFKVVEKNPKFPGGDLARIKFFRDNIKYPGMAIETGIHGTVYVNFVVEPDGSISNISVGRGIGGGCDEEAVRVVKMMPKWKPGRQRGKAVRVSFNLPIHFKLL